MSSITLDIDKNLKYLVQVASAFKSPNNSRPEIDRLHFEVRPEAGIIRVSATDGYAAVRIDLSVGKTSGQNFQATVDPENNELKRTLFSRAYKDQTIDLTTEGFMFARRQFVADDSKTKFPIAIFNEILDEQHLQNHTGTFALGDVTISKLAVMSRAMPLLDIPNRALSFTLKQGRTGPYVLAVIEGDKIQVTAVFMTVRETSDEGTKLP